MKRIGTVIVILLVFAGTVFFIIKSLEYTPVDFAEKQSGLELPNDLKIVTYDNPEFFGGDICRTIEFSLQEDEMRILERRCKENGYKKMPISDSSYLPKHYRVTDEGYYRLEITSKEMFEFEITILNITRKRLYLLKLDD